MKINSQAALALALFLGACSAEEGAASSGAFINARVHALTQELLTATAAGANASISVSANGPGAVGVAVNATVSVTNTTTNPLVGAWFYGYADSGALVIQAINLDPLVATCLATPGNWVLVCQLGSIDPGATSSFTVRTTPLAEGTLVLSDQARAPDIAQANLDIPIGPPPTDLQITGFAKPGSPPVGTTFSYTFQVKNGGSHTASGVTFTDSLPASLTPVSVTSPAGTCTLTSGVAQCSLADLPGGQQTNVVVIAQAPASPGTVTNTASVDMATMDTNPANNSVAVSVQVK